MTRRQAGGFSLLELLVVVAVMIALVALVVPSLKAARESARFAVCKSNLRQQGLATIAYSMDYRGYGPCEVNFDSTNPGGTSWMVKLAPYLGGGGPLEYLTIAPSYKLKVLQCPSSWNRVISIQTRQSYGMNMAFVGDAGANSADPYKTNVPFHYVKKMRL